MFSSPMYVRVGSAILRLGNLTDFQLSQWWYQNPLVLLRSDSQAHFAENIRLPAGGGDGFVLSYDALPAAANNLYLLFESDALCFDPFCEETTPAMSPAWYFVDNQPSIQDPCPGTAGETSQNELTCSTTMDPIQRPNRPTVPSWDMLQLMPSTLSMVVSDCDPASTDCSAWQLAIHAAFPGGGTSYLLDLTGMRIQGAGVTGATEWYIFKDSAIGVINITKPDSTISFPTLSKNTTVIGMAETSEAGNGALPSVASWEGTAEPSSRAVFLGFWQAPAYTYEIAPASLTTQSSADQIEAQTVASIHVYNQSQLLASFDWNATQGWTMTDGYSRGFSCPRCSLRNGNCRACDWGIHRLVQQDSPDQILRVFELGQPEFHSNLGVTFGNAGPMLMVTEHESSPLTQAVLDSVQTNYLLIPRLPRLSGVVNDTWDQQWSQIVAVPDALSGWMWMPRSKIGTGVDQLGMAWKAWWEAEHSACAMHEGTGSQVSRVNATTYASNPFVLSEEITRALATDILTANGQVMGRVKLGASWQSVEMSLEAQPLAIDLKLFNRRQGQGEERQQRRGEGRDVAQPLAFKETEVNLRPGNGTRACVVRVVYPSVESADVSVYMSNPGDLMGDVVMTAVSCSEGFALPGFKVLDRERSLQPGEGVFEVLSVGLSPSSGMAGRNLTLECWVEAQVVTVQRYWSTSQKNDSCVFQLLVSDGKFEGIHQDICTSAALPAPAIRVNRPPSTAVDDVGSLGLFNVSLRGNPSQPHRANVSLPIGNSGDASGDLQIALTCQAPNVTVASADRVDLLSVPVGGSSSVSFLIEVGPTATGLFSCTLTVQASRDAICTGVVETVTDQWQIAAQDGLIIPYLTWLLMGHGPGGGQNTTGNSTNGTSNDIPACVGSSCGGGKGDFLDDLFPGYSDVTQVMLFLLVILAALLAVVFIGKLLFVVYRYRRKRRERRERVKLRQLQANISLPLTDMNSDDEDLLLDQIENHPSFLDAFDAGVSGGDDDSDEGRNGPNVITQFCVLDWTGQPQVLHNVAKWHRMYIHGTLADELFERCLSQALLIQWDPRVALVVIHWQDGTVNALGRPLSTYSPLFNPFLRAVQESAPRPATRTWLQSLASPSQLGDQLDSSSSSSLQTGAWRPVDEDAAPAETPPAKGQRSVAYHATSPGTARAGKFRVLEEEGSGVSEGMSDREIRDDDDDDEGSDDDGDDDDDDDEGGEPDDAILLIPRRSNTDRGGRSRSQRLGFGGSSSRFREAGCEWEAVPATTTSHSRSPTSRRSAPLLPMPEGQRKFVVLSPRKAGGASRSRSRSPKKRPQDSPRQEQQTPGAASPTDAVNKKGRLSLSKRRFEIGFHINT